MSELAIQSGWSRDVPRKSGNVYRAALLGLPLVFMVMVTSCEATSPLQHHSDGVLSAQEFHIIDAMGKTRASLTFSDDALQTRVYSKTGKEVAKVEMTASDTPRLSFLTDQDSRVDIQLRKETAVIVVGDSTHGPAVCLRATGGECLVALSDRLARVRTMLTVMDDKPELLLFDSDSNRVWSTP